MAKAKTTEVATLDALSDFRIATLGDANVREIVEANTGGAITLSDLTQVTIPSGGATSFEIDNPIGDDESEKEIEGVLIYWNDRRSYWMRDLDDLDEGDDRSPDCFSANAVEGMGSPGGDCRTCPLAAWGSQKGGNGQACKAQRLFFFLRSGSIMPIVLRGAPTSIAPSKKYLFGLASEMVPYWGITTKISLDKQGSGAIKYATLHFSAGTRLTGNDLALVERYRNDLLPALEASTVNPPARVNSEGNDAVNEEDLADLSAD
jgi:hypothetical protein